MQYGFVGGVAGDHRGKVIQKTKKTRLVPQSITASCETITKW